ncbi:MAG: hypothetical protein GX295_08590 [Syntrophomonadaceae bacterium]|nr:hypothetical protein [Syntrophomonadaceae bacterium]
MLLCRIRNAFVEKGETGVGYGVWELLNPALLRVNQYSEGILRLNKGTIQDYIRLNLESLPLRYLPALALVGACYYGQRELESGSARGRLRGNSTTSGFPISISANWDRLWLKKVLGMSAILQMLYLASEIHNQIQDGEGDNVLSSAFEEKAPHFPVLFGDYIFGKVLRFLCKINCVDRVPYLAEIICQINEGGIIRKEVLETGRVDRETTLEVLNKEFGYLFIEAGRAGVLLAGGTPIEAYRLGHFGGGLGGFIGAVEKNEDPSVIDLAHREAVRALDLLPEGWLREAGQQFIREITSVISTHTNQLVAATG